MRLLSLITVLLLFSALRFDTIITAQRATIGEPPFVSDLERAVKVVKPVYPTGALKAGVEGVVILEVHVGKDGRVEKATVMSGPLLLRRAAADAVTQWVWDPFLLNSQPIRVRTRATVKFDLHKVATQ